MVRPELSAVILASQVLAICSARSRQRRLGAALIDCDQAGG
jgi:hypothetical protein